MSNVRHIREPKPSKLRRGAFRRGKGLARLTDFVILLVISSAIAVAVGLILIHQAFDRATHAKIDATWSAAQAPIVTRLKQPHALQYGDVWGTHTGVVCGLVNGWGSFGGLSAMTPFYVWKAKPFFAPDIPTLAFAPGWRECLGDHWIELVKDGKPVTKR